LPICNRPQAVVARKTPANVRAASLAWPVTACK
jgi:hypothetical protein